MAIKLDKNEQKKITMDIETEGIERDKLNFTFRIEGESFELGFPGEIVGENKLQITVPPLKSVGFIKKGNYDASLEVDDNDRYFMKPWQGEVQVESSPEVKAVHEEEIGKTKQSDSVKVTNISESSSSEKPKKKEKKWTKEDAKKFINEARKRLKHKDPEKVDKYIAEELEKRGFKYTPKKKKQQPTQEKKQESFNPDPNKPVTKQDVIDYLNSKGMKKDSSVNYIMEKIDHDSGGDPEKMLDLAKGMLENNFQQDPMQQKQMQSISDHYSSMGSSTSDESAKQSLQERISQAKAEMSSKLNS